MNPTRVAEKQGFLAKTAGEHPDHRFTNLYDLLHWDYWMHTSAESVLARPSSHTDGVDGQTRLAYLERCDTRCERPDRSVLTATLLPWYLDD